MPRRYGNANTPARPSALLADLLEQIQMLSPVNRFGGDRHSRIVRSIRGGRPHRGRKDDQRQRKNHREPKCEAIWFLRHAFPSLPRIDAPDVRGRNRERYVNYFTLARNNPLACLRFGKKTLASTGSEKKPTRPAPRQQPLTPPTSPAVRRRRSMPRPRDAFRRETFALPREKAREMVRRLPQAAYMTEIESWRELPRLWPVPSEN